MTDVDLHELGFAVRPGDPGPRAVIGLGRRIRSWLWVHRVSGAVLGVLLAAGGAVTAVGMTRSPVPIDDEGTYVAQAWAVQTRHQLAHYTYWYDHPPFGWIQIALWTWITRGFRRAGHSVFAGRELMVVAAMVSAALVYVIARRLGTHRWAAALAVGLFLLSPLAVSYHRMVLLDNVAVPWALASFALVVSPRRSLWAAAASGLCFAAAVLSKETFLLLLPALLLTLWQHCDRRTRAFCITAFVSVAGLVLLAYPLYAVLKGELVPGAGHVSLIDGIRFQLVSRAPSGAPWSPASPLHRTLTGWLSLDPWLIGAGAVLIPAGLLVRRVRPIAVALGIDVLMLVRGGYVPGPFVVVAIPLAALLVAVVADATVANVSRLAGRRWGSRPLAHPTAAAAGALAIVVVILAAAGSSWYRGDRVQMTADPARGWTQAERWVDLHVPRTDRVIVDDTMWVDLVDHGFHKDLGVVWFFKLDSSNNLDPSVQRRLPDGWRAFRWIVSTPAMRASLRDMPGGLQPVRQALAASTVTARYGTGPDMVEVRRIDPGPAPAPPA